MPIISIARAALVLLLAAPSAPHRAPDAAAKIDFTISGGGHQSERVMIRDVYPEVSPPYAQFYHSGIMFGIDAPILELRGGKLGPRLWAIHFLLVNGGPGALHVGSVQPAIIYNGDNSKGQQSWFPQIVLPPLKQGTLAATVLPNSPPGRVRGTFAGTLVDDKGNEVSVSNGTFDLARRPDVE
jgi:hypothetical protein